MLEDGDSFCRLHVVHECVDAASSELLAQRTGWCDEMSHALGDLFRLIISKELLFQRTYFDCILGKFVALVSSDDEAASF